MQLAWRLQRILHRMRHGLRSPARNARSAVVIGRLLGVAFLLCFATGLYSHLLQDAPGWMVFPTRPTWLYRVTQGIHVTAGIAAIPLLLGKLHAVYPELYQRPPVRTFPHFLERASIALLVSASLVQVTIGVLNTFQFYALFPFSFRATHFALSFVIVGSLLIHLGVKLPTIARYWRRAADDARGGIVADGEADPDAVVDEHDELRRRTGRDQASGITGRVFAWIDREPAPLAPDPRARVSRRGFFAAVGIATAAVVTLTAGQSFRVLDAVNLFAPRKNGVGPQGLPVNHTAEAAGVVAAATSPEWRLTVANGAHERTFDLAALRALPQHTVVLPIACVEGWSQDATWTGPRLRDLVDAVGAPPDATIRIFSLQEGSPYAVTDMQPAFARDALTLVALELEGEALHLDHGYPARVIAPARPGVLQTKWLSSLRVL